MNQNDIARRVIQLAADQVGVDAGEVTPQSHFVNDLNYDSLDMMEFVMNVEDAFSISVPDGAADKVQTVGQAIDYVMGQLGAAPRS
jgi:acyl carrier protein